MRIKKILSQHRRDLTVIYICEHCKKEVNGSGYDDTNFHKNVIPAIECGSCGKKANEDYIPLTTKYPDGMVV